MNHWFRGTSLCIALLVGMLGLSVSLASVACAQDAAPAATEPADAAGAGDSAEPAAAPAEAQAEAPAPTPPPLNNGDQAWMLASSALVLFMTPGLAFFYGGWFAARTC